ncbi:MAG: OmpH family outer membrane protein [Chlorobi bacterium]|nr:OmpH family outer membrane protein [Chlorobiota bacterium]
MLAVVAITVVVATNAFAQKIGYVASDLILINLPEASAAQTRLGEIQAGWLREIEQMENEQKKLRNEIETNRLIWSQQERKDAEAKLANVQARLTEFRKAKYAPKGEYEKLQGEIMKPVFDNITRAIEEEAKSQKMDIVFDKSSTSAAIFYVNPQVDLTIAVLKRLGVSADAIKVPEGVQINSSTEKSPSLDPNELLKDLQKGVNKTINVDPNKVLGGEGESTNP